MTRPAAKRRVFTGPRAGAESLSPTLLAVLSFACGCAIHLRLDVVGEVFLAELLLVSFVLILILAKGVGRIFDGETFLWFFCAGLVTLTGYLLSDISSSNEPWQYLKGWGRVVALVVDSAALMLLVSHGRKNLWWFMLGIGVGGVAALMSAGVPFSSWKSGHGYGDYAGFLIVACASLLPAKMGVLIVGSFGVASLYLDYRSLGAAAIVTAGFLLFCSFRNGRVPLRGYQWLAVLLVSFCVAWILFAALVRTDQQYEERRELSNTGRIAGLTVAWRAITESPFIGYGSWAADTRFARMLDEEARRQQRNFQEPVDFGRSLLPHSQFLQAWIEGGLLGTAFFLVYAWGLVISLRWVAFRSQADSWQASCTFVLILGLWHLVASPFLGINRIYIALAVAAVAIARYEKRESERRLMAFGSPVKIELPLPRSPSRRTN